LRLTGLSFVTGIPMHNFSHSAIATVLGLACAGVHAQDAARNSRAVDSVVVTGTAVPVESDKIGNSLTVVSAGQIENGGYTYTADVLRQVPGLSVNRSGPTGGLTRVRTRGAESNHTVVLFNGVDVSDAGQGETDLATLLSVGIDHIEVLRGPQSGLYGSNALAGVINILTRKQVDGFHYDSSAEYGTLGTATLLASGGMGEGDRYYVHGAAGYLRSQGYDSSTAGAINGAPGVAGDKEGNENATAYLTGGYMFSEHFRVDGFARYLQTHAEFDGQDFSFVPGIQGNYFDDASEARTHSYNLAGSGTLSLLDGKWVTLGYANYTNNHAEGGDGTAFGDYGDEAYRAKYGMQSSWSFGPASFFNTVTGFAERKKEQYRNTHPFTSNAPAMSRELVGYGAQYQLALHEQLYLSGVLRRDNNDAFEDDTTYSVSASWVLRSTGTRPHASLGTGLTNPSFYEQFGFDPAFRYTGNPDLKPEKARGWDVGVEQTLLEDRLVGDVTWFKSRLRDEISSCSLGSIPSSCNATGRSEREGVEVSGRYRPAARLDLLLTYTYLDANEQTAVNAPRTPEVLRPRNQAALDATLRTHADKLEFTLGATYNGQQYDLDYRQYLPPTYSAPKVKQDAYTLVRLAARYKIDSNFELFARVENLFDENYSEVVGFLPPGRTGYVGVRYTGGAGK
jgi:vitamin B12 transporter